MGLINGFFFCKRKNDYRGNHQVVSYCKIGFTLLYIRTSKLKPKLTRLKSGSFLLIEIIKFRFQFDLVFVKRDLFCTKNRQNESESKDYYVYLQTERTEWAE